VTLVPILPAQVLPALFPGYPALYSAGTLTLSGPEYSAIGLYEIGPSQSRSCAISCRNFDVLRRQIWGGAKFLSEFYKSGSPSNMWQSLVTIGQVTSEIRRRKKKDLNCSCKAEWPAGFFARYWYSKSSVRPSVCPSVRDVDVAWAYVLG